MFKKILVFICVYILLCVLAAVLENIVCSIISICDYNKTKKAAGTTYNFKALLHTYFIILGKSFKSELFDNSYHDWLSLIALFLMWPVHLLGWIFYLVIPPFKKTFLSEYKKLYADYDKDYANS